MICGITFGARAQAPNVGTIKGIVFSARDSGPVAGAEINLVELGKHALTNERGHFSFDSVADGVYKVEARRFGYEPAVARAEVTRGSSEQVIIRLLPAPRELEAVQVRSARNSLPARLQTAFDRVERNHGVKFTGEDIRERNPVDTKSLLERVPGVLINDRSVIFARCSNTPSTLSPATHSGTGGRVQVYIDGVRMTEDVPVNPSGATEDVDAVLRRVSPSSIELMEVYSDVARIPAEFLSDACAVIVIWTKRS